MFIAALIALYCFSNLEFHQEGIEPMRKIEELENKVYEEVDINDQISIIEEKSNS